MGSECNIWCILEIMGTNLIIGIVDLQEFERCVIQCVISSQSS